LILKVYILELNPKSNPLTSHAYPINLLIFFSLSRHIVEIFSPQWGMFIIFMAKKTPANSILKKQASERLTGKKAQSGELRIKGYELSGFEFLHGLGATYDNICISIAACISTVVLLVQLRCLRPDTPSSKLDQLPCFRFYKKRILTDDPGLVTAFTLAICNPQAVILFPSDMTELEKLLINLLDCYQGNERFIEKCSSENLSFFIYGHMSRIMGIMSSCCSANMTAFGLASDCANWTVADVLSRIPFPDINNLDPQLVKNHIRKFCLTPNSEGGFDQILFQELPFTGGFATSGGCAMEFDIFGSEMPIRATDSKESSSSGAVVKIALSDDQLKGALNPIDYQKLQAAISLKRNDIIKKLMDKANKAIQTQEAKAHGSTDLTAPSQAVAISPPPVGTITDQPLVKDTSPSPSSDAASIPPSDDESNPRTEQPDPPTGESTAPPSGTGFQNGTNNRFVSRAGKKSRR
jgi:hypothetical protein